MTASCSNLRKKVYLPMEDEQKDAELWTYYDITNCYSYALGLLYDIAYLQPGQISGMEPQSQYTDEEIIKRVESDVTNLGFLFEESTFEEVIENRKSWKIVIFNTGIKKNKYLYDYHFVKQHTKTKKWYHKLPGDQFPSNYDARGQIIINPEIASYEYAYNLIGYYKISQLD